MDKKIYLDYAATTPMDKRVFEAMKPYLTEIFGNPSSIHFYGRRIRGAVDAARAKIAEILNCKDTEVVFTGGGTESDNLAIKGVVEKIEKPHVITTTIEHHAVLHLGKSLENEGIDVSYVAVDKRGIVEVGEIEREIKDNTVLVSVMYANNEVGTIQPICEIAEMLARVNEDRKKRGLGKIFFHTDACQAAGYLDMDVKKLGVDLMSFNGAKIYGPQGVGVLYVKQGVRIKPMMVGGDQELSLRPGTENVAGIAGMAEAFEIAQREKEIENVRLKKLRDRLKKGIEEKIRDVVFNGEMEKRLPGNLNVSILGAEGEAMTLLLDEAGINVSTGSACSAASLKPSHVLLAMGIPEEVAHGSLRISLGRQTTEEEVDYVLEKLPGIVEKLRDMSGYNNKSQ